MMHFISNETPLDVVSKDKPKEKSFSLKLLNFGN